MSDARHILVEIQTNMSSYFGFKFTCDGNPKIIVTNTDPILIGKFSTELFSCLGTKLAHNSSYHPQSNGKTEILNKCLEDYLRCFAFDKQTQWMKWLSLTEWWYNSSFHMS